MIDAILAWSLRNRLLVIVGALLVSGWGAWETLHRPVDVFPDLTAPTVTVLADAHDMAPVELETLDTMPIEAALTGEEFESAMKSLAGLRQPIDAFFDQVTVNVDDSVVRGNRLRLLARIQGVMNNVADFSKIEG